MALSHSISLATFPVLILPFSRSEFCHHHFVCCLCRSLADLQFARMWFRTFACFVLCELVFGVPFILWVYL